MASDPVKQPWKTLVTMVLTQPQRQGAFYPDADAPTSLREHGTDTEYLFAADYRVMTFGQSRSSDHHVTDGSMSATHFEITREFIGDQPTNRAFVRDLNSRNGLWQRGERVPVLSARAGDVFLAGNTRFIFCNDAMRQQRYVFAEILGTCNLELVDNELAWAIDEQPVGDGLMHCVVVGAPGTEAGALARAIHAVSRRRAASLAARFPTTKEELIVAAIEATRESEYCSLLINLHLLDNETIDIIPNLLGDFHRTRIVAVAHEPVQVFRLMRAKPDLCIHPVFIPNFATREDNINGRMKLVDRMLEARGAHRVYSDLTNANDQAIYKKWPTNNKELRQLGDYLARISRVAPQRRTLDSLATAIGARRSTLHDWIKRHELTLPIFRE